MKIDTATALCWIMQFAGLGIIVFYDVVPCNISCGCSMAIWILETLILLDKLKNNPATVTALNWTIQSMSLILIVFNTTVPCNVIYVCSMTICVLGTLMLLSEFKDK